MTKSRDKLFATYCPTEPEGKDDFSQLYHDSLDILLYWKAEQQRDMARVIEERCQRKTGAEWREQKAQAEGIRRAADRIDPFVEANGVLYRKRDNRVITL